MGYDIYFCCFPIFSPSFHIDSPIFSLYNFLKYLKKQIIFIILIEELNLQFRKCIYPMDVKNLETFVMVNELKKFYAGGRTSGLYPVHRILSDQTIGKGAVHPLFERIGHTVTLTNEGEKLLPLAQQILRLAAEATHICGNTAPEGLVRIAIAESLASWEFHSRFKDFMKISSIRLKIMLPVLTKCSRCWDRISRYCIHTGPPYF